MGIYEYTECRKTSVVAYSAGRWHLATDKTNKKRVERDKEGEKREIWKEEERLKEGKRDRKGEGERGERKESVLACSHIRAARLADSLPR